MRTASSTLHPAVYGTLRTAIIGYGVAAFSWLFTKRGIIEDPLAAEASSTARLLFASGIACQVLAFVLRLWIKRTSGSEDGANAMALIELLADGATVLIFAVATFRGINALALPL
jgi:type IV secretory pathway TrbD component